MFYITLQDGGNLSEELIKSPFIELKLGDQMLKVNKLQSSFFSVKINDEKKIFNSFAKLEISGCTVAIQSLDLDLFPAEEFNPRELLVKAVKFNSPFPCLVFFKDLEVAVSSCFSQKKITLGSGQHNTIVLEGLFDTHCSIYIKNNSVNVSNEGNGILYVDSSPITGLVEVDFGSVITLNDKYRVVVVNSENMLNEVLNLETHALPSKFTFSVESYPCLIARSPLIRPLKLPISTNSTITIGREPSNDIWVPAPHVSRVHLRIKVGENFEDIQIEDCSTNGTLVNQTLLKNGDKILISNTFTVINLGKDLKLGLCFNENDEEKFLSLQKTRDELDSVNEISEEKIDLNASKRKDLKKIIFRICVIILIMVLIGLLIWNFHS